MMIRKSLLYVLSISALFFMCILFSGCEKSSEASHTGHMHDSHEDTGHHMMDGNSGHMDAQAMNLQKVSGKMQDSARVITLQARQFAFDPSNIVVNQGEKVKIKATSEDVMHGIAIEAYDIESKLPPDKETVVTFSADTAGTFHFHCSVYCGSGHGAMGGTLIVKPSK